MTNVNASQTIPIQAMHSNVLPEGFLPRGCTFAAQDWPILAKHWFPVARAVDVQDQPLQATLLDLELVVYRTPGGIHVGRDLCPHRGVPLSMGCVEGEELVCAYHGLRFGDRKSVV